MVINSVMVMSIMAKSTQFEVEEAAGMDAILNMDENVRVLNNVKEECIASKATVVGDDAILFEFYGL